MHVYTVFVDVVVVVLSYSCGNKLFCVVRRPLKGNGNGTAAAAAAVRRSRGTICNCPLRDGHTNSKPPRARDQRR